MKYPFSVYQTLVDGHEFWVAECPSLKGCVGQGNTPEAAIDELSRNEKEWLETAEKYGIPIPLVPIEALNAYSGKFTVRISPAVHRETAEYAKKQNISLNQHVNDAIVAYNSRLSSMRFLVGGAQEAMDLEKRSHKAETPKVSLAEEGSSYLHKE